MTFIPYKKKFIISKIKDLLGWESKIVIRKGLPCMVFEFQKCLFFPNKTFILVKKEIVKVTIYSFLVINEAILFTNNIVIKIEIDP
jgi:hypothetical protein